MKNTYLIAALLISCTTSTFAQYKGLDVVKVANSQQPYINENIHIPDIEGYKTLKCDFHCIEKRKYVYLCDLSEVYERNEKLYLSSCRRPYGRYLGADLYFNESIDWARSFSAGNILASFPDSLYGHLAYFSPKTVCRQLER